MSKEAILAYSYSLIGIGNVHRGKRFTSMRMPKIVVDPLNEGSPNILLVFGALMMNTFKLNIVNSLVVTGLVAASM